MAGARIRRIMAWVPQSGDIGVGVSILSYSGGVQFGLITDKRLCPEPQRIIDRFAPEFEKLVLSLCMLPWERPVDSDEAESWLFPSVPGPAPSARQSTAGGRAGKRRPKRAHPPEPANEGEGDVAAEPVAAESAAARPAGIRRRRSAFAAARTAE